MGTTKEPIVITPQPGKFLGKKNKDQNGPGYSRSFLLVINMAREFAKQFYSTKAWQNCRNQYGAKMGWLCEDCMKRGIYTPGVEVHHVEELTPYNIHRPEVTLNPDNLVLLCRECHKARHKPGAKDRRYTIGPNGEVICDT